MAPAQGKVSPADPDARTRDKREASSQLRSGRRRERSESGEWNKVGEGTT